MKVFFFSFLDDALFISSVNIISISPPSCRPPVQLFEAGEAALVSRAMSTLEDSKADSNNSFPKLSGIVLRLRGLPFSADAEEVIEFIKPVEPVGGERGVLFTCSADGRPSGEAFLLLSSEEDELAVMSRHKGSVGQRYIEIFKSSKSDLYQAVFQRGFFIAIRGKPREYHPPLTEVRRIRTGTGGSSGGTPQPSTPSNSYGNHPGIDQHVKSLKKAFGGLSISTTAEPKSGHAHGPQPSLHDVPPVMMPERARESVPSRSTESFARDRDSSARRTETSTSYSKFMRPEQPSHSFGTMGMYPVYPHHFAAQQQQQQQHLGHVDGGGALNAYAFVPQANMYPQNVMQPASYVPIQGVHQAGMQPTYVYNYQHQFPFPWNQPVYNYNGTVTPSPGSSFRPYGGDGYYVAQLPQGGYAPRPWDVRQQRFDQEHFVGRKQHRGRHGDAERWSRRSNVMRMPSASNGSRKVQERAHSPSSPEGQYSHQMQVPRLHLPHGKQEDTEGTALSARSGTGEKSDALDSSAKGDIDECKKTSRSVESSGSVSCNEPSAGVESETDAK